MGYKKEDFTGFSSVKTDYKSEPGLKTLVPDNNVYYDPINANVIHMDSNKVKVLTGSSSSYNVYDMTDPADVNAINKLPQNISPNRKTYCYEVLKNKQYLVYIPTLNNSFIHIINVESDDYFQKNAKLVSVTDTELKSIMTEKETKNFRSLDNSNKLFMPNPMCVIYMDGDNIKIMSLVKNEAKTFNKNDKTNILNFVENYKRLNLDKEGICVLYEIIPQKKYLFYLSRDESSCLTIIDVNSSSNAIANPQRGKDIVSTDPISKDTSKNMNPTLSNSPSSSLQPAGAMQSALQPAGAMQSALQPAGAMQSSLQTSGAMQSALQPAGETPLSYNINDILNAYPNFKKVFINWYRGVKGWEQPFGIYKNSRFSSPTNHTKKLLSFLIKDPNNYQQELTILDKNIKDNDDTDGSKTKPLVVKTDTNYMDMYGNSAENLNNVMVNLAMTSSIYQM